MGSPLGEASSHPDDLYELVAQYRDDAYRLARYLVRSPAEAEDLAQTAILNTLRRAEYIADVSRIRSYLLMAVRNLWRNQLRARGGRRFVGADMADSLPSTDLAPDEQVLTSLDVGLARAAMESLSTTSREILELRYLEGLGFPELAQRLSISPVAARQRAHRAREELIGACMDHAAQPGEGECGPMRARLGRFHRGLLSRKTRSDLEHHLSRCDACQDCYDQLVELYGARVNPGLAKGRP